MGELLDGFVKNVKNNPWRFGAIVLVLLLVICYFTKNSFSEGAQGPNPTQVITLYYKPNCPSCQFAYYHWAMLSKNLKTDGKIRTRAVDCDDPNYAEECSRWPGHPVFVKTQASGDTRVFRGNITHQSLYNFANRDY